MSVKLDITEDRLSQDSYRVLHAGDDYNMSFTVERAGSALDLTGSAVVYFTVKEDAIKSDANAKLQLSSADSAQIEITDAANGQFTVKFVGTGAKSTENMAGLWPYDIQAKLDSGTIITVARGLIEFLEQITRATS